MAPCRLLRCCCALSRRAPPKSSHNSHGGQELHCHGAGLGQARRLREGSARGAGTRLTGGDMGMESKRSLLVHINTLITVKLSYIYYVTTQSCIKTMSPLIEVCIDSAEGAQAAEKGGAQRVELCAALIEGGITPSAGMIRACRSAFSGQLMVMVRPRGGGDFVYSDAEVQVRPSAHSGGCVIPGDYTMLRIKPCTTLEGGWPRTRFMCQPSTPTRTVGSRPGDGGPLRVMPGNRPHKI